VGRALAVAIDRHGGGTSQSARLTDIRGRCRAASEFHDGEERESEVFDGVHAERLFTLPKPVATNPAYRWQWRQNKAVPNHERLPNWQVSLDHVASSGQVIDWRWVAAFVAVQFCGTAPAAEVCRFAGTTDYAGHVAVTTAVTSEGGATVVDVAAAFESTSMFLFGVRYLLEEVSIWRGGRLENVAVNSRYLLGRRIVRQQWDEFRRAADGMQAERVQAKTLAAFRRRHPGFVQHWDPATFGQPWLRDYPSAPPERRIDLDLHASPVPSALRSPLAMSFYWIRWLPHSAQDVPVFLPGFKADRLVGVPLAPMPVAEGTVWRAVLHYASLSERHPSTAAALVSPDEHLLRITFELHTVHGSGRGDIEQQGCDGSPVPPGGEHR
jgi:hypothetical protein